MDLCVLLSGPSHRILLSSLRTNRALAQVPDTAFHFDWHRWASDLIKYLPNAPSIVHLALGTASPHFQTQMMGACVLELVNSPGVCRPVACAFELLPSAQVQRSFLVV